MFSGWPSPPLNDGTADQQRGYNFSWRHKTWETSAWVNRHLTAVAKVAKKCIEKKHQRNCLAHTYTDEIIVAIQLWTDSVWLNVRAASALCLVLILQSALATLSLTLKCIICTGNFLCIYKNDMQCISCSRLTYMANDGTRRLNSEVTQDNSGRQLSPTWKSSGTWYTCGKNFNAKAFLG